MEFKLKDSTSIVNIAKVSLRNIALTCNALMLKVSSLGRPEVLFPWLQCVSKKEREEERSLKQLL
jgi:hypothetical protein